MTRLAFLGTPEVAVGFLRALHSAGHDVAIVVTAPDRRRGRGSALAPTPVKQCALDLVLPVSSRVADVLDAKVELGVVVAFGTLIRADVLGQVPMVNLHFSLLPRWRGAAPVERAILAGDDRTGVCLMALDEGLDTGPVYARVEVPILPGETAAELRARLADLGTALLLERLAGGVATLGTPVPQTGEALYAAKIDGGELRLAWQRPAVELDRLIRIGRTWTTFRGKRLIVERARVVVGAGPGGQVAGPGGQVAGPGGQVAGPGGQVAGPGGQVAGSDGQVAGPGGESAAAGAPGFARPVPGTLVGDRVVCGQGCLELLEVRPEGRSVRAFDAWLRGARPAVGECLGE